jgi:hypothetical protein
MILDFVHKGEQPTGLEEKNSFTLYLALSGFNHNSSELCSEKVRQIHLAIRAMFLPNPNVIMQMSCMHPINYSLRFKI